MPASLYKRSIICRCTTAFSITSIVSPDRSATERVDNPQCLHISAKFSSIRVVAHLSSLSSQPKKSSADLDKGGDLVDQFQYPSLQVTETHNTLPAQQTNGLHIKKQKLHHMGIFIIVQCF